MIVKALDLCTSHLRKGTAQRMEEGDPSIRLRFVAHEYGYMLFVKGEIDPETEALLPNELKTIHDFALANDCMFINFDADAKESDQFEVFEW